MVEGDCVVHLSDRIERLNGDMAHLIEHWADLRSQAEKLRGRADCRTGDVAFLAPVERPGKIWGIGLNYRDHIEESGSPVPEEQTWFVMANTTVAGPYQDIELPRVSKALDYEAELVFVVGKRIRYANAGDASDAIFGYCVGNDISVRDWQLRTGQFSIGKSFDTHAPYGPWIVTADEIDPLSLPIRSYVNDEVRQQSNTQHLLFTPAQQVEHLSKAMTLEPGDVFFTGTPGGVGGAMSPPQYLEVGDRVRVEIDGLGYIENTVAKG
ncbi:fumarylacetoacetate hydrolase family protein [Croceicoccus pelagius]|uniref:fumarylacetoacetate hydrolase family protein n=1 Tax=Croceicoccus pelagius TaxID=1703341 RepID=UPI001E4FEB17|nr:fumarylacetoacetate hydrolase family protein [Croceicoccus pelagius]